MAPRSVTTILKGPFFEKDPGKTFRQNIRVMMDAVAAEGQADVRAQLQAGQGSRFPLGGGLRPGRVSGHVIGRTVSLVGKRWAVSAKISVNNRGLSPKQGVKLMAAASYLEGQTHAFRRTKGRIGRAKRVNAAELLKGLV
jgi:hypothetical protein